MVSHHRSPTVIRKFHQPKSQIGPKTSIFAVPITPPPSTSPRQPPLVGLPQNRYFLLFFTWWEDEKSLGKLIQKSEYYVMDQYGRNGLYVGFSISAQQTQSSQQSLDSPCDTNTITNEFGDIELPNLHTIANSSSAISNISLHNYNGSDMNSNMNMNLNMNWPAARGTTSSTIQSLSWPSCLLTPNLSMNSLLLRALQLRSYQQREAANIDYSYMPPGISQFGTDFSLNFPAADSFSKVLDSMKQQPPQEQPFNLDSIW